MGYESLMFFVLLILTLSGTLDGFYSFAHINNRYALLALLALYVSDKLPYVSAGGYDVYIFPILSAAAIAAVLFIHMKNTETRISAAALGLAEMLLLAVLPLRLPFVLDSVFMGHMLPLGTVSGILSGTLSPDVKTGFASSALCMLFIEPFVQLHTVPSAYIGASWGYSLTGGLFAAFILCAAVRLIVHLIMRWTGFMLTFGKYVKVSQNST